MPTADYSEFNPPGRGALVVFSPKLMRAFFDNPPNQFMIFDRVSYSEFGQVTGWVFTSATTPSSQEWIVTAPYFEKNVKRPSISEKDKFSRLIDPTSRYRDANLQRVFRPDR